MKCIIILKGSQFKIFKIIWKTVHNQVKFREPAPFFQMGRVSVIKKKTNHRFEKNVKLEENEKFRFDAFEILKNVGFLVSKVYQHLLTKIQRGVLIHSN